MPPLLARAGGRAVVISIRCSSSFSGLFTRRVSRCSAAELGSVKGVSDEATLASKTLSRARCYRVLVSWIRLVTWSSESTDTQRDESSSTGSVTGYCLSQSSDRWQASRLERAARAVTRSLESGRLCETRLASDDSVDQSPPGRLHSASSQQLPNGHSRAVKQIRQPERTRLLFLTSSPIDTLARSIGIMTSEPEFEQAVGEIKSSLGPLFKKDSFYEKAFEVVQVPERIIQFRVVWENDKQEVCVNRGYRVQFNSTLGPYKGGLRFHPTVNLSILKFLGFEQIFKNALTGLHMGGGKGGADFDPKGKSDNEIRRFCGAFMAELSRHIGDNTDVPAGDIGVSPREIGWMFGAYKRARNEWAGVLTGKGFDFGGSLIRPEATGFGLIYYVQHMIAEAESKELDKTFEGKTVAITGSGNVAQYAALKAIELGAVVVSLSDSKGALIASADKGITPEDVHKIADLKVKRGYLKDAKLSYKYIDGARPWTHFDKLDIALPCATQNEVSKEEAEALVKAGVKYVAEGSNMGCTKESIEVFEEARKGGKTWYGPGKASNSGGVAVSGLEMAQNSSRVKWTTDQVDEKLKGIMADCYKLCFKTAQEFDKEGKLPSLVAGANIAGVRKTLDAMKAVGDVW
ncbi:uncharacterized protein L969DRAFT_92415 [Mixia osmundae IAM 14324]|uniref:glutamate dehydrogenase (NADP(+)) n=1 Tax=Mixia osmundae (strain CBS 9802 / IAM 14324 / JCM 22182 / KY 12970) TaxID=764103 RepID=G7DXL4_MIXOS|nr:uncharacterized protein L969DRAFT_92415 [Mixia osmundae IAM 14324]KEI41182.1 hypothetical protein L969DRAFT_92415 [Mixia osmundae IAM 14324]GAA95324.1 hypothetical protein E5Q_01981 [Mixia osmundae IAM 14324]